LLVAPQGRTLKDLRELAQALRARGAELLVISQDRALLKQAHTPLRLPEALPEWLSPLVAVVPGQRLALQLALSRGCEPDRPRGLSKVTRTT
jgi:glucosamine--fructose-6-phosphate aminotransferase (isomerizing)